jgi:hypothetical protein
VKEWYREKKHFSQRNKTAWCAGKRIPSGWCHSPVRIPASYFRFFYIFFFVVIIFIFILFYLYFILFYFHFSSYFLFYLLLLYLNLFILFILKGKRRELPPGWPSKGNIIFIFSKERHIIYTSNVWGIEVLCYH